MKPILFLLSCIALPVLAQTPQRTDFTALINQMPKLPATTQAALSVVEQPNSYLDYRDKLNLIVEAIQKPNPVSQRAVQKGVAMDSQFKADKVDQMTDSQKMAYAKQKNLGGAGSNARIDFAQQMQDPDFQKKFQAMSPQEQMAMLQKQGVVAKPNTTPPPTGNPMQADMVAMMQDPAMREKWKSMSQAERQAFIEERKKAKGYDQSKRPTAQAATDNSGGMSDMLDGPAPTASTPVAAAMSSLQALQTALTLFANRTQALVDQQQQGATQRQKDLQRSLTEAGKVQQAEGMAEARRQGKTGENWILTNPAAERQMRINSNLEQQRADNATLTTANTQWQTQLASLRLLAATYQQAMSKINYGESLYADDSQFQNLVALSSKQAAALSALQTVADSFNKLSSAAAADQSNLNSNSQPGTTNRLLMQSDGG